MYDAEGGPGRLPLGAPPAGPESLSAFQEAIRALLSALLSLPPLLGPLSKSLLQ